MEQWSSNSCSTEILRPWHTPPLSTRLAAPRSPRIAKARGSRAAINQSGPFVAVDPSLNSILNAARRFETRGAHGGAGGGENPTRDAAPRTHDAIPLDWAAPSPCRLIASITTACRSLRVIVCLPYKSMRGQAGTSASRWGRGGMRGARGNTKVVGLRNRSPADAPAA